MKSRQEREVEVWMRGWRGVRDFGIMVGGVMRRETYSHNLLMKEYCKWRKMGVDVYAGIFTHKQIRSGMFDTIFIDIDKEKIEGRNIVELIVRRVREVGIEVSRVYYSGRGYHLFIDFEEPLMIDRNSYRASVRRFIEEIGVSDFVDMQVVGDANRLGRLPHSMNTKTGMYMVRIRYDDPFVKIEDYSKREVSEDVEVVKNEVKKFEGFIVEKNVNGGNGEKYVDEFFVRHKYDVDVFPQCVKNTMEKLRKGIGTSHYERLHLANFLILIGWSDDEIVEVFKNADDFNERYTRYQIQYSRRNRLNVFSCERAYREGFCSFEEYRKCPYKPLTKWVRW